MPVDVTGFEEAQAALQKRYGQSRIHSASVSPQVERISTGSLEMDYATGGGIPIGRFSRMFGGYSAGKTLACWNITKIAQDMGMSCCYHNAEKQFDPVFVASKGIDMDKLIVCEGSIIEEVATNVLELLSSVHLHIIDSCSTCVSKHELESDIEDQRRGGSAKFWAAALRRIAENMEASPEGNTIVLVDQIRDVFGSPGASPQPPGGRMMEHTSSLTMSFRRGAWLFRAADGSLTEKKINNGSLSGALDPDGLETQMRVEKSRVGRQFRSARMRIDFKDMSYDLGYEYANAAIWLGLTEKKGAWYTLKTTGDQTQGERKLGQAILSDDATRELIYQRMKEIW